jgi:hypothetical protein
MFRQLSLEIEWYFPRLLLAALNFTKQFRAPIFCENPTLSEHLEA